MNIIDAIINLVNNPVLQIVDYYQNRNRANSSGDALEEYVKDLFANSFNTHGADRLDILSKTFSYLGNNNNPPDAMLRNGDMIEIKKIESENASLALNSSYPKQFVTCDDRMISNACKSAETWSIKDIIYTVGVVDKSNTLKHLCMVYGRDYCASHDCYGKIKNRIKDGVESIPGIEFTESKELGHVNKIDPLGITYLRVRGMWGIENPWKVFNYVYSRNASSKFNFMCIINDLKWNEFDNKNELICLSDSNHNLIIKDIQIKNPDNPAILNKAKLITYEIR